MLKRRKRDYLFKAEQNNSDDNDAEDYTADCETYDFPMNANIENELHSHFVKVLPCGDSCDMKQEIQAMLNEEDEVNPEYVCRDFLRNMCRRGRKCKFNHPSLKRQWSTKNENINASGQFEVNFCHDFQNNGCTRPQCRFIHCSRSEQEFYYATGILLPSVPCSNFQVPYCKDFINNTCTRIKCKYLHLTKDEIDQQNKNQHLNISHDKSSLPDYLTYNNQASIEQSAMQTASGSNSNFFSSFPSSQQMNVMPSQPISLGNNMALTNAQFTVSLPLGSVSYSTSQQQLITQPSLTNVQYIHDPILSSVAHEVGSINSDVINHHNMVSQIHHPQQVVYSGIIHNPGASIAQHHAISPQFTIISSDNQSHSQLLTASLAVGNNNATGHIINPVAVAHPNPTQNQQYTISQQPHVGMSLFSVTTPCSLLSASPTTAEVVQTIQQQQLRTYEAKDPNCVVQKGLQTPNIELAVNDSTHINSTLTPIYIHHSLPSSMPVTQYRVTALETTNTPGLVIHNGLENNNVKVVQTATSSFDSSEQKTIFSTSQPSSALLLDKEKIEQYSQIIEENEKLKRKLQDLEKQTCDLQTANELLLDQNARLRNLKGRCSSRSTGGKVGIIEPTAVATIKTTDDFINNHLNIHNSTKSFANQSNITKQSESVSNAMSEMATITLTVPLTKTHTIELPTTTTLKGGSVCNGDSTTNIMNNMSHSVNKAEIITYSMSSDSNDLMNGQKDTSSESSECSEYISPTLVTSAIRSIQKSVMPTLHALVASSSAISATTNCSMKQQSKHGNSISSDKSSQVEESSDVSLPVRSSSCPATSYKSLPEQSLKCLDSAPSKVYRFRFSDYNHTPQVCFQ